MDLLTEQILHQTRVLLQCVSRSPFHDYNNENVCSICLHHYYNISYIRLALVYFTFTYSPSMKGTMRGTVEVVAFFTV